MRNCGRLASTLRRALVSELAVAVAVGSSGSREQVCIETCFPNFIAGTKFKIEVAHDIIASRRAFGAG
jgi:hypothetical protein